MIPNGYQQNERRSPLTDPWEPLYSREAQDAVQFALEIREAHCNARGFAHGGLLSALADNAMGRTAVLLARRKTRTDGISALTVSMALDFIDSAQIGDCVELFPAALKVGRTLAFVECRIAVGDRVVARANATFRLYTT